MVAGVVWWLGLTAVWLWLGASVHVDEVLVGAACTLPLALAAAAAGRWAGLRGALPAGWWRLVTVPWSVASDAVRVLLAIGRRPGVLRTIAFRAGGDTPADGVRRALVELGISAAPNTFVVALDPERGRLLVHQRVPRASSPDPSDPEWPL